MSHPTQTHRGRRAISAVFLAVSLVVLIGAVAIVVDLGSLRQVQTQLQVGVDAAALAGASHLDGTSEGLDASRAAARAVGSMNPVREVPIPPDELLLAFGVWDPATRTFTPSEDVEAINAIRVTSDPRSVSTPFAAVAWNLGLTEVSARAMGLRPPPEPVSGVDCFLPVAVPTCRIDAIEAAGHPWVASFHLAADGADTIAWAHPDGASAASFVGALEGLAAGTCAGTEAEVGDDVPMTNGVDTVALHAAITGMRTGGQPWDAELWGPRPPRDDRSAFSEAEYDDLGTLQGAILVIDPGDTDCDAVSFAAPAPLASFAWGVIFDVYTGPGTHKGAQIFVDFEHDFEAPGSGGGSSGNVKTRPPGQLVE